MPDSKPLRDRKEGSQSSGFFPKFHWDLEWHLCRNMEICPQTSISHVPFKRHLITKPSIMLLMTLFHITFLVKTHTHTHSCLESSPRAPKRGHGGRELEGTCVCPGLLSQPDSSLLLVQCSSPLPSSPGSHAPSAGLASKLICILHPLSD